MRAAVQAFPASLVLLAPGLALAPGLVSGGENSSRVAVEVLRTTSPSSTMPAFTAVMRASTTRL